ncbi:hypothetical protein [Adhaeribacter aquaticus]|uniref:hypothetical protein n=1 Tax=Adhaeribacter aquaticus TaxID=299567 RepID=UPI0004022504|nr:hypothetical protein [Adhaeribacter aquaticus]
MPKILLFSFLIPIAISVSSCSEKVGASGLKQKSFAKFYFHSNNRSISKASVYKRYIAHNRDYKSYPTAKKGAHKDAAPNKERLALTK